MVQSREATSQEGETQAGRKRQVKGKRFVHRCALEQEAVLVSHRRR